MPHPQDLYVIILAAGNGTRMQSDRPKVLHEVGGLSLLGHVLATARSLKPKGICVVVSPTTKIPIEYSLAGEIGLHIALQTEPLGTGHAAQSALPWLQSKSGDVLILCGDVPFLRPETLHTLRESKAKAQALLGILGMTPKNPGQYGRLFLDGQGYVEKIVEFRDIEASVTPPDLCNSGIMLGDVGLFQSILPTLKTNNIKKEYYLTDVVALAREKGHATALGHASEEELMGVNHQKDLAHAESVFQQSMRDWAMEQGVKMMAPETVFFSYDTKVGADVVVEPYVVFAKGVTLDPGCHIKSFSHLEGAHVKSQATVGPFARLRTGTTLEPKARIGNFVEIKASSIGQGAKVSHLSYVGDSVVGEDANLGAGTITCNYDGFKKHKTIIGKGAFIGSNSALVAPVSIGDHALIAAGSVVTEDVGPQDLAIARSRQINIPKGQAVFAAKRKD